MVQKLERQLARTKSLYPGVEQGGNGRKKEVLVGAFIEDSIKMKTKKASSNSKQEARGRESPRSIRTIGSAPSNLKEWG